MNSFQGNRYIKEKFEYEEFAFSYMWFHLQEMIGEERKLCPAEAIQSRNAKLSNLLATLVHYVFWAIPIHIWYYNFLSDFI